MNLSKWTTEDWIIRGLVGSHISVHTLYRWYTEHVDKPVDKQEFRTTLLKTLDRNLIYNAGHVTCYEHERHEREAGWALTDKGRGLDPALREEITNNGG